MNARTLLTMDLSDKVYLVDVRVGDEMEQSDLLNISLVYSSNYYNSTDSQHLVSNLSIYYTLLNTKIHYNEYIMHFYESMVVLG